MTILPPPLDELRQLPQWVVWRSEQRGQQATKVPYNPHALSVRASATDPATWGTYEDATGKLAAANASERVKDVDGVGFVPTEDDPYAFVDLDGCVVDGKLVAEAQEIVNALDTYWEQSPSGTGVRLVLRGSLPPAAGHVAGAPWAGRVPHAKAQIEAYDHGHYFAMMCNGRGDIADRQGELDTFAERYLGRAAPEEVALDWNREPAPGEGFGGTDDELLAALREDARFVALFDAGETSGDASKADYELCVKLAELVGDHPRRIEQLWGGSALAGRAKFDRADYRERTIRRAIARVRESDAHDAHPMGFEQVCVASAKTESDVGGGTKYPSDVSPPPPSVEPGSESGCASVIGRTAAELRRSPRGQTDWVVPGVAARGWTVLIAGREKIAGKGTLITYLLSRLERGEATVFGPPADEPITALIFTEEPWDSLREKLDIFNVERATVVFHYELAQLESWDDRVAWLVSTAVERGHGLIHIDNVSRAADASGEDEAGTGLARKINALSTAAKQHHITVLLDHHNRKSGGKTEDLLRGGTALPGAAENIIAIDRSGDWTSRRRRLYSRGRIKATGWERTIELTEDGTDYGEVCGDFKLRQLATRDDWTAADFGKAISQGANAARNYLNASVHVEKIDSARGGTGGGASATVYRVKNRASLLAELEPDDEPTI